MSELIVENQLFDSPAPELTVEYRPLESRRIRRFRLESAEVAAQLGDANRPMGSSVMSDEDYRQVVERYRSAARAQRGLF